MVRFRKAAAVVCMLVLGLLLVLSVPFSSADMGRFEIAMLLLSVPILATSVGLSLGRTWARWLALGAGLAILPWASVLVATPHLDRGPPAVLLGVSIGLLALLGGRTMAAAFSGPAGRETRRCGRETLLGWTIISNIASMLVLYLFVAAYDFDAPWQAALTGALLVGLLAGVVGLAREKTVGILAIGAFCALLVPALASFIASEASYTGEAVLLAAAFLPGVGSALVCFAVFARPMWRVFRA